MKKKILIANNLLEGGGVEALLNTFVQEWHNKYDITIITGRKYDNFYQLFPPDVKYLYYARFMNAKRPFRRIANFLKIIWHKSLVSFLNHQKYDCMIALKEGETMRFISLLKAKRKLAWVHTNCADLHWTKGVFASDSEEIACMKTFDYVICVAKETKRSICDVIGNPGNLIVRYNPINETVILNKSKQKVMLPEKRGIRFVSVGRLAYEKGYDMLLNACKKLTDRGYNFEVWIIGDGGERERLEKFILNNQLTMIKLWGWQSNPYNIMKDADWFISTSRAEGYSLVSQEAAILDIPIMATDCSGVREFLGDNGEYGIIMRIDEEDIYFNMKSVIENQEKHQYYKNAIKERKKIISFDKRLALIEELL